MSLLAAAVNFSAALGRLAVDSIVQRDAPGANRGRAFARYETRYQLGWVVAGVVPVLIRVPGEAGFLIVGVIAAAGAASYLLGSRTAAAGRSRKRWAPRGQMSRGDTVAPVRTARGGRATDPERRAPAASEVRRRP